MESGHQVIIVYYGSFNPIHTQHIRCITEAREWLINHTRYKVLASYLVLTDDEFVQSKCGKGTERWMDIKFTHRKRMCEIACDKLEWLNVLDEEGYSLAEACEKVKRKLCRPFTTCAIVFGIDRFVSNKGRPFKYHYRENNSLGMCLGRKGMTVEQRVWYETNKGRVSFHQEYYVVPFELDSVSSTEIRNALKPCRNMSENDDKVEILQILVDMVNNGWIIDEVAQYLYCQMLSLFLKS